MLRGGPLAETRVINLLNRRFVSFYFNVGRGGQGYDADAAAYIARVDRRFSGNAVPTPPVWVFSPDGKLLATINNYATREQFAAELRRVLDANPDFDAYTPEEQRVVDAAAADGADASACLAAARLQEELGRTNAAATLFGAALRVAGEGSREAAVGNLGLARLARITGKWATLTTALAAVEAVNTDDRYRLADEVAMERAYHLLAGKQYAALRSHLEAAVAAWPNSRRLGEMRFTLGVACFFLDDPAWANYHWCWVMKNLPDDHLYMRCYMAASREAIPYPNPELGGYRSRNGMVSHALADAARDRAMEDYHRLQRELDSQQPDSDRGDLRTEDF